MSVVWQREYASGVKEIDQHHQELFSRLEDLLVAIEQGRGRNVLSELYEFLDSYTRRHFSAEEKLQERYHYPHTALHREEHRGFLKSLENLRVRITSDGPTDELVRLTRDTLNNWLIRHICSTDRQLGLFVREHRTAEWDTWMRSAF